jgi:hypothetical protein
VVAGGIRTGRLLALLGRAERGVATRQGYQARRSAGREPAAGGEELHHRPFVGEFGRCQDRFAVSSKGWELAWAPVTGRSGVAHEELIEAELLMAGDCPSGDLSAEGVLLSL